MKNKISKEYIIGFVEARGIFTFSTNKNSSRRIPSFMIKTGLKDKLLLELIRDDLGLKNRVYEYAASRRDGFKRNPQAVLMVRDLDSLQKIIIPMFSDKLLGSKSRTFQEWLERINGDPMVPETYKIKDKVM